MIVFVLVRLWFNLPILVFPKNEDNDVIDVKSKIKDSSDLDKKSEDSKKSVVSVDKEV